MTVREELQRHMEREKVSIAAVAKAVGKSPATISLWARGDYAGDSAGIDRDVAAYLSRMEEKAAVPTSGEFVLTRQAAAIIGALRYAHTWGQMGVIYGPSGLGKTSAIRQYAATQGGVIVITIDPVSLSPSAVLHDVAEAIGESTRGTLRGILRRICKKLDGSGRLIIVDEAQFLTHRAIESLRKIHDTAKVPVVFSGMPRLYHHMVGNGVEIFEQIRNRIGIKKELPPLSAEDASLILRAYDSRVSDAVCKVAFDFAAGCARRLVKLYNHAARAAASENRPIEPEDFIAAQEFLYEDRPVQKPEIRVGLKPAPGPRPPAPIIQTGAAHATAKTRVG